MIEIDNVNKVYRMGDTELAALGGVSLTIADGEMVAIMGASGSGKSTLMNILGCLDVPTSGRYILNSEDVGTISDGRLAEIRNTEIGFIFQTYNLLPRLTALANVELALMYGDSRNRRQRAQDALERVGLRDRVKHHPTELSGGQQQRVGIARALVKSPGILLADEPTGNLDSRSGDEIMAILQELHQEGITVIIVTHETEIADHANRTITMRDGLIVADEQHAAVAATNGL
jgi:putative ABC transport system ATP-binding protein